MSCSKPRNFSMVAKKQMSLIYALPNELFEFIFRHLDLVSLVHISATCTHLRSQVHGFFVALISSQATAFIEIRESLSRMGWSRIHDDSWTCKCFQIVAGPCFTWAKMVRGESFSMSRLNFWSKITTVAGKTFFIKESGIDHDIVDIRYWTSGFGKDSSHSLYTFEEDIYGAGADNLVSYDNTLAFSLMLLDQAVDYRIIIYNPRTLLKITQIVPFEEVPMDLNPVPNIYLDVLSVTEIALTENTLVIHLMGQHVGYYGNWAINTQVWSINTKDPQEDDLRLVRIINHPHYIAGDIDGTCRGMIGVNKRFVARMGQDDNKELLLQVFHRVLEEHEESIFEQEQEPLLINPVGIQDGKFWIRAKISSEGGEGDHLALSLLFYNPEDGLTSMLVQVYSATRGNLIIKQEFNVTGDCFHSCHTQWFGPHLIVTSRQGDNVSLHSWQPGACLTAFVTSPFKIPVVKPIRTRVGNMLEWISSALRELFFGGEGDNWGWTVDFMWLDYQSITTAMYEHKLHNEEENEWYKSDKTYFQTWGAISN